MHSEITRSRIRKQYRAEQFNIAGVQKTVVSHEQLTTICVSSNFGVRISLNWTYSVSRYDNPRTCVPDAIG